MERCGLESQTNFFPFKKSPKTECGLDSSINGICNKGTMNFTKLTKSLQQIMEKIMAHFPSLFGLLGK